ncbi:MAG TPA: glyoxalase/bleomycin resistance/extradiol dioxygenase family protein [Alphaproteobacteria bacterium]|nr:glyoxalase/bleomycin resistance/extradiol dioxygenase family protein [Alphaproteobacteria bacterium]
MRDLHKTRAFYEALGFICAAEGEPPDTYLVMIRGTIQMQFFEHPGVHPHTNYAGCIIYVPDLKALYEEFAKVAAVALLPVEPKPWGTTEFAFHDPAGNLIRVAQLSFEL